MAVNIYSKVEYCSEGTIISKSSKVIQAGDGSYHHVPIINCNALIALKEYNSDYDYSEDEITQCEMNTGSSEENKNVPSTSSEMRMQYNIEEDITQHEINTESSKDNENIPSSSSEMPDFIHDKESVLKLLLENEVIKGVDDVLCNNCRNAMVIRKKASIADGYIWQCNKCKTNISIRKGTIFEKSKLAICSCFKIIYFWSAGVPGHTVISLVPSASKTAIYDWFKKCREISSKRMTEDKIYFTGSGVDITVQIDESAFGKTQKYHRGKKFKKIWIFGISQPAQHKCLLVPVEKRDEKTLMRIILDHVDRSCHMRIVSDGWAAYNKLKEAGYQHSVVIHKTEFVNREGHHTNSIESVWSQFKSWIVSMHGLRHGTYDEYIHEFMYRYNLCGGSKNSCFKQFICDLRRFSRG